MSLPKPGGVDGFIAKYGKTGTGIYPESTEDVFENSPNPATDFIEISVRTRRSVSEQSDVKIFDVFGQTVLSVEAIHELPLRIDVSYLAPGMYFVRIGDFWGKFLKI
jgi:hypothetical protein